VYDELNDPDFVNLSTAPGVPADREAGKVYLKAFTEAYPDVRYTIDGDRGGGPRRHEEDVHGNEHVGAHARYEVEAPRPTGNPGTAYPAGASSCFVSTWEGRNWAGGSAFSDATWWPHPGQHLCRDLRRPGLIAFTPEQAASPLARRPYDLRHAAISPWLNAGVPATEVARRAGHGVAVMLKVYANKTWLGGVSWGRRQPSVLPWHEDLGDHGLDGEAAGGGLA
jgi:hypothetical protein